MLTVFSFKKSGEIAGVESREMIIDDLRRLGVKVNQLLVLRPATEELKGMRDGLMRLQH